MIAVERGDGGIARIVIDRPEARNAMTFAMWDRLRDVAHELDADEAVRIVIVTGAGERAFVAGTDIAEFGAFRDGDDGIAYEARIDAAIDALEAIRVPTIAAVAGACTGGGVSIAATCDLRIGSPATRVGIPIARTLGNCISARNLARVAGLIGLDAAKALIFSGTLLDAATARRVGFLSDVTATDDALHPRARELADELSSRAPLTLRATKEMARRLRAAAAIPDDRDLIRLCYGSEDFREGRSAFLDKRPPLWRGR